MKYVYRTNNSVCAHAIEFEVVENRVHNVIFHGGCDGNHKGIAQLAEGMGVDDVISRLAGICCGMRSSSCPDQLARALQQYKSEQVQK